MPSTGEVRVRCPGCGAAILVPVAAETASYSDDGVVYLDLILDETEIEMQALVCTASTT
jgi:hypothetical protein